MVNEERVERMLREHLLTLQMVLQEAGEHSDSLRSAIRALTDINFALDQALIVAITDVRGDITFVNSKFCEISKYSRDELIGRNHRLINSGYHSKEFFKDLWRTISQGKIWRGEIRNRAKDGTIYWMDTTIVPNLNEQGKPYQYVSFRNEITEKKQTEAFLRRAESIAAIGQMASGIAHEIRNPLAAIQWTLQLLELESPKDREQLQAVFSELDRVNGIVGELLVLAKPQEAKYQDVFLDDIFAVVVNLMSGQARRHHVTLHTVFEPMPKIRCEPNQLKQVLINLIKNAVEAMPAGGQLWVQAGPVGEDQIRIRVRDEGRGIPEELIPRIGEPFFSTKEKGTGLGMMVCHKIIQDHGGKMIIESQLNKGTTVDVLLPVQGAQ